MHSNNPYEPPSLDVDWMVMRRRAIQVGREEIHTVIVQTSLSRGLKTHTVDATGEATPIQRGPCRIQIGEREKHLVEVGVDATYRVNVLVDGKLVEEDLFPRMRATIFAVVIGFMLVTTVTVTLGVVLLVRFLGH